MAPKNERRRVFATPASALAFRADPPSGMRAPLATWKLSDVRDLVAQAHKELARCHVEIEATCRMHEPGRLLAELPLSYDQLAAILNAAIVCSPIARPLYEYPIVQQAEGG